MRDSPHPLRAISIGFNASASGNNTSLSAAGVFNLRRVKVSSLEPEHRRLVVCGDVEDSVDWLPPDTFLFLLPADGCCSHGLSRVVMGPVPERPMGTFASADYSEEVMVTCGYSLRPVRERTGWRRHNLFDRFKPGEEVAPELNVVSIGKKPAADGSGGRDAEIQVSWPFNPAATRRTLTARYTWAAVNEGVRELWEFSFSASSRKFAVVKPSVVSVVVVNLETGDEESPEEILADAPNRFQLSAEPDGGRIGFIGPYGNRPLNLSSFRKKSHSGVAEIGELGRPENLAPEIPFFSAEEAASFPSVISLGRLTLDPVLYHGDRLPLDWSGSGSISNIFVDGSVSVAWEL